MHPISSRESPSHFLSKSSRWMLASIFVTNIGNGMHYLILGKLLYDRTGTIAAFGGILISEYLINFVIQIVSGPWVDRNQPRTILLLSDLIRGIVILLASFNLIYTTQIYGWIWMTVLVINICKPFYRSASFSIGPEIAPGNTLVKYNAYYEGFQQGGQLLGVSLAGFIIKNSSIVIPFALNGLSYVIAALFICFAAIPKIPRNTQFVRNRAVSIIEDWKEIFQIIQFQITLGIHLVLACIDYLAVNLIELLVVPMVNEWQGNSSYWLALYNGSFAMGAVVGAIHIDKLIRGMSVRTSALVGLFGQSSCFLILCLLRNPYFSIATILSLGVLNTLSFTSFVSALQRRSKGPIKGRIVALRNLCTGLLATLLIPLVTYAQKFSTVSALQTSAVILLAFASLTLVLSWNRMFGESLLGLDISREPSDMDLE